MAEPCLLCSSTDTELFWRHRLRHFWRCQQCDICFVPKQYHLGSDDEKARYDTHNNTIDNEGYCRFLSQIIPPMQKHITSDMHGLDFGCGPNPVLAHLFEQQGFVLDSFDPFYAEDNLLLDKQYDFVCCTEVVEHFNDPASGWAQLSSLVKPGGYLGIMTSLLLEDTDFKRWRYKDDLTHVNFLTQLTIAFLCEKYGLELLMESNPVLVFRVG